MTVEELRACPVGTRVAWIENDCVNGIVTINDQIGVTIAWDDQLDETFYWEEALDDRRDMIRYIIRLEGTVIV